jgi:putative hydrolase of the HAD superfamily
MEALIFDVGGVLLVPDAGVIGSALGMTIDGALAERAHYVGVHAMDLADDETAARRDYLVAYARTIGVADERLDEATACMKELWDGSNLELWRQRVSGSVEALHALSRAGTYKLGIVSNADGTIEEQLRRGEICQVGEGLGVPVLAIIDSGVVGVAKPAAEIFAHALSPLGVVPASAVYVGDTVRYDIRGARAAGLRPVHLDPLALCVSPREDHEHIRSLAELTSLVR